jgi:hypothetical protein
MAEAARRIDVLDTAPRFTAADVAALNARFAAVPTREMLAAVLDGWAAPAGTCNLRNPVTFFAISYSVSGADLGGWQPPHLPHCCTIFSLVMPGPVRSIHPREEEGVDGRN